jgi:hypothetical protein
MIQPFVAPKIKLGAFHCPQCSAYAQQDWRKIGREQQSGYVVWVDEFMSSFCTHCKKWMYWHNGKILVPDVTSSPPPNDDLGDDIKADYAEAASIIAKSPRGAAALLRLCIQKLCKQLGESGNNINKDIGELVKKGLDARIQKALDTVRVIGNEALHPGEMDLKDDPDAASQLFVLINTIANDMITQPRVRDELYNTLPQSKRDGIANRDANSDNTAHEAVAQVESEDDSA